jgi:hypothetical protein
LEISHITWEACDTDIDRCTFSFDIKQDGTIHNLFIKESIFDKVTNLIESCIFLNKITIIATRENRELFKGWLTDIVEFVDAEQFKITPIDFSKQLVYSNVLWNKLHKCPHKAIDVPSYVKFINIALTVEDITWKTITKQKIQKIRKYWDAKGTQILTINALFYNKNINIFKSFNDFVCHFKLLLDYACMLGCTYVIYGSPDSKHVRFTKIDKYETYQQAHQTFIETMRGLAEYAKSRNITIIIKPNTRANYLCNQENVDEMVSAIEHPHVQAGKNRQYICTPFKDFNLVEFQGNQHTFEMLLHKIIQT